MANRSQAGLTDIERAAIQILVERELTAAVQDTNRDIRMSVIDRIRAKALQARDVAPEAIRAFEADLDELIAEKAQLEQKRVEAIAPHKEAISGIRSEIDGVKKAMDILSNGGDPLLPSAPVELSSAEEGKHYPTYP